ncbi:protein tyrosine phosphatase [Paraburkholderia fungorum]|uniref:protein-tyrosine-phosphatase n=2 Tax=Burkholderiaceae TaxID=119060 RepID=A0A1H1JDF2_9BURK|nr:low molecular weight protein arginine phosphatase [Paraburkholderia fungorum]SDR48017.1 protein tyrosine phosphatase [Paraburkholderia fungorum]
MISNVLTVCHGNLCRSPMAAAMLKSRDETLQVRSAGLAAEVGQPATSEAVAALTEIGIDIRSHRATQLTRQLANEADLILTMTSAQSRSLQSLYPTMRGRIFTLCGFDGIDIDDPFGLPLAAFRTCREALRSGVDYWAHRLNDLNEPISERVHSDAVCRRGGVQ